jgi:RecQ family ATP-dependent DNA helicase
VFIRREDCAADPNGLDQMPISQALQEALSVLQDTFGFSSFRLQQARVIERLLEGKNAVVIFPTGGGKSLCYQVPALAFRKMGRPHGVRQGRAESGITVVVSPLIALMKDQCGQLTEKGVKAFVWDSLSTGAEYRRIMDSLKYGTLVILFCAPEKLNNQGFNDTMAQVRGGIRLLAIDEAHCISEWGHDFRPDYLKLARFGREMNAERIVRLTATATPKVAADMCDRFGIDEASLFRAAVYRPNLRLLAESFQSEEDKNRRLKDFLITHHGPTIIYSTTTVSTETLAEGLRQAGFQETRHYHAGLSSRERNATQEWFMASDNARIVSTIAFGMRIDKPNIRNVIHYTIPQSIEGYSQETGRAGRDGKDSTCLLFLCDEGVQLVKSFSYGDLPSETLVRKLMIGLFNSPIKLDGCIEARLGQLSSEHDFKVERKCC